MNTATRNTDPISSHLAESDITTSGERKHQNEIALDVVMLYPGLTSKKLAQHCPLDRYQLARRLNDLFIQGKVDKTDGKREEQKWYAGTGKILPTSEKPIEALQLTQPGGNSNVWSRGTFKGLQESSGIVQVEIPCSSCGSYYRRNGTVSYTHLTLPTN